LKGDFYSENLLKLLVTIPFRDSRRKHMRRTEYIIPPHIPRTF